MIGKGGRGKQAPYDTTHTRIPENIKFMVESLSSSYREYVHESGCVKFDNRGLLPSIPAIYIVFDDDEILYVGQSKKLSQRWNSHNLLKDIKEINEVKSVNIAWINCNNINLLTSLESILIKELEPRFNSVSSTLDNLVQEKPKWNNLPTKAVRVPKIFADIILELAREWDKKGTTELSRSHNKENIEQAIAILNETLKMPANKGGAIKKKVREVIKLLQP